MNPLVVKKMDFKDSVAIYTRKNECALSKAQMG
jgi:hypothetical protein